MTNTLHITPDRETKKNHLEWAGTRLKSEVDGDRESAKSPMANDICSPCDPAGSAQYNGESMDFGDAGGDLI